MTSFTPYFRKESCDLTVVNKAYIVTLHNGMDSIKKLQYLFAIGGWVETTGGVEALQKKKLSRPCRETNRGISFLLPVRSHCTNSVIPALQKGHI
jgi:hypothetical protein